MNDKVKWVRPVISIIAVLGLTVGFFLKLVTSEAYVPVMAMAIAWWFQSRDIEKK